MERTSTGSVWMDVAVPDFPTLDRSERADVCVVGAGIAGLSTAYGIACDGRSVIVLDDGRLDGYLFAAPDTPEKLMARELEAARRAGVPTVSAGAVVVASS
jgi:flavin-dependent dehydrogenase